MVLRLSALHTGRFYPPGNMPGTPFCYRLGQPQDHSAIRRDMSMKNSIDTVGNRTRDLTTCRSVPQPTVPPLSLTTWQPYLIMRETVLKLYSTVLKHFELKT